MRKYRASEKGHKTRREYEASIEGSLGRIFNGMNQRCNNTKNPNYKYYGLRGTQNKFQSLDKFRDYVINELKVDPRGKHIHRIDNDGDYEPGNIEFLTPAEHNKIHAKKS